MTFNRTDRRAW